MIPPREQWCIQIDVTNACGRGCSNCTRMTGHVREPFFMDLPTFEGACKALAAFPEESQPDRFGRRKVVGIIGGEPLLHPGFSQLVTIIRQVIPEVSFRGLWTSLNWRTGKHAGAVRMLLGPQPTMIVQAQRRGNGGYLNWNRHDRECFHQPVLVAVQDVIHDEARMWRIIDACPLQEEWSGAITPKGFFFCEVAAAMDMVFEGPGGMPITPGCWRHDLADYRDQIEQWCPRCGVCLPLQARRDKEQIDDISESNLGTLRGFGSPRIRQGQYEMYDVDNWNPPDNWNPLRYHR